MLPGEWNKLPALTVLCGTGSSSVEIYDADQVDKLAQEEKRFCTCVMAKRQYQFVFKNYQQQLVWEEIV